MARLRGPRGVQTPFGMEEFGSTEGMGSESNNYDFGGGGGGYTPPSGNTGVSGYIPGGQPMPNGGGLDSPNAPPSYLPPNGNTGWSGMGGGNNPRPGTRPPGGVSPAQSAERTYAPIQGFDYDKITGAKPYDSPEKYSDSLRAFSQLIGSGTQFGRDNLGPGIEWLKQNGFPNAVAVGDDKIDFGDGQGPIDVITSNGQYWFQNGADRFQSENAAGGGGDTGSGSSGAPNGANFDAIRAQLAQLFPDGAFNQDIVNRRTDNVRDQLNRFEKSRNSSNRAMLAERGLLGSGPEATAQNRVEEGMRDQFANAVSGIYADESQNADQRMMQALSLAAGLTSDEARNIVDMFNAGTGRQGMLNNFTLGQGQLALDNMNGVNTYNLGLGRLGLDRDQALWNMQNGGIDQIMALIQMLMSGAQTSAGGHI